MGYLAIILSSFFGSIHCAGMCGGFALLCASGPRRSVSSVLAYHLGRLNTYLFLGALSGMVGGSLRTLGSVVGAQYAFSLFLGVLLIASGIAAFFGKSLGTRFALRRRLSEGVLPFVRQSSDARGPALRSFLVGMTSTFLPCGWLYSFVAVAAAAGTFAGSLSVMIAFWVGSLPALLLAGELGGSLGRRFGRFAPKLTALAIIAAGFFSLVQHDLPLFTAADECPMHGHGAPAN